MVKVDLTGAAGFFTAAGPDYELAALAHKTLADKSGLGNDFTGWVELPRRIKETELERIVAAAEKIRSRSKALVVIGIGGSYLGARGAIELLKPMPGKDDPKVFFMGNTLSTDTICDTIAALGDMDFDVNVISKSGTTLEPATRRTSIYSPPPTSTRACSTALQSSTAGRASLFPTTSAGASASCPRSACCRWPSRVSTCDA